MDLLPKSKESNKQMSYKIKAIALAESCGCEIQETGNGSVYLNAPEGKHLANHGTSFMRLWDGEERELRPSWKSFYSVVALEVKRGFVDQEEE
jgi:hypothetical protein